MTQTAAKATPGASSVRKSIQVAAPVDVAFRGFTQMKAWWPLETHKIGAVKAVDAILEPREGGRWYERGEDGTECEWGRVLAWEPPTRLVLDWQLTADFRYDRDLHTEVEVRFVAEGPRSTRVELEHRGLEQYGERAAEIAGVFESPGGWSGLLAAYAASAASQG